MLRLKICQCKVLMIRMQFSDNGDSPCDTKRALQTTIAMSQGATRGLSNYLPSKALLTFLFELLQNLAMLLVQVRNKIY